LCLPPNPGSAVYGELLLLLLLLLAVLPPA
jgi:hypothetical protein